MIHLIPLCLSGCPQTRLLSFSNVISINRLHILLHLASNYGEPAHVAAAPAVASAPVSVPPAVAAAPAAEPKPAEPVPPPVSRANKPQLSSSNDSAPSAVPAPLPDSSSSLSSSPPPVSRASKPSNYASPTPVASAAASVSVPPPVSRDTKPKKAAEYASPTSRDPQLAAHNETIELLAEMFAIWNPKEPIAKNDVRFTVLFR